MSDDQQQENGNSVDVPEIELIIKVSPRLFFTHYIETSKRHNIYIKTMSVTSWTNCYQHQFNVFVTSIGTLTKIWRVYKILKFKI